MAQFLCFWKCLIHGNNCQWHHFSCLIFFPILDVRTVWTPSHTHVGHMTTSLNISCQHLVLHLVYISIDITKSYGVFRNFFLTLLDGDVLLMILYVRQFPSRTHCARLVPSMLFASSTTPKHIQIGLIKTCFFNWIFQQHMPIIKHRYDILHYDQ